MKSRKKVILACVGIITLLGVLFATRGYNATWELWGIPTMEPHFADVRVITHGAVSHAQGLDPLVDNPEDPWNRKLNYPRIWQGLFLLGIGPEDTTWMGLCLIVAFLAGVCLLFPTPDRTTLILLSAALLSPAILLGIERANNDLLIFLLLSLAVLGVGRPGWIAHALALGAFVLKLFPLLGWVVFVREGRSVFLRQLFPVGMLAGFYLFATFDDLALIASGTPQRDYLSFGRDVVWMELANHGTGLGQWGRVLCWAGTLAVLGFAGFALLRPNPDPAQGREGFRMDAFRLGAAIYVGTFLIGNNWDYRLMFLIFALPQWVAWMQDSGRFARRAKVAMVAWFVSLWHMGFVKLLFDFDGGYWICFAVDEAANWTLFAVMAFLLGETAPDWLKDLARAGRDRLPVPLNARKRT